MISLICARPVALICHSTRQNGVSRLTTRSFCLLPPIRCCPRLHDVIVRQPSRAIGRLSVAARSRLVLLRWPCDVTGQPSRAIGRLSVTGRSRLVQISRDVTARSMSGAPGVNRKSTRDYIVGLFLLVCAFTYAAVPMYRLFCQAYAYGGTTQGHDATKVATMSRVDDRELTIRFNADTQSQMAWSFKPLQNLIKLKPGETALAFYTAKNATDAPINGIATYNVVPFEAGAYFNKIQCFCFEEQRLNPGEEVDMPVFFYIDPDFCADPAMYRIKDITLSYTFFQAKEGLHLPLPGYSNRNT